MSTTSAGFSMSGESLTDFSREIMFSKNWKAAFKFLQNCFGSDISADDCFSVLKGDLRFQGTNMFELVEEEPEIKETLNNKWSQQLESVFCFKEKLYRPYGYIRGYGADDYHFAIKVASNTIAEFLKNKNWLEAYSTLSDTDPLKTFNPFESCEQLKYRSCYYLKDLKRDLSIHLNLPEIGFTCVLFEQIDLEVPLWIEVPTQPQGLISKQTILGLQEIYPDLEEAVQSETAEQDLTNLEAKNSTETDLQFDMGASLMQEQTSEKIMQERFDQIVKFADSDAEFGWAVYKKYFDKLGRNVEIRVPLRAFICASLSRARAKKLMPAYTPVCPSGLKMFNDCAFHTDAWIGAGFCLEDAYNEQLPEQELFMDKMYELQRQYLCSDFDILAKGSSSFVKGEITFDPENTSNEHILVLDSADPDMAIYALRSKAVVVETGSKLAHLVVVSREESIPVIRISQAKKKLVEGKTLFIDFSSMQAEMV